MRSAMDMTPIHLGDDAGAVMAEGTDDMVIP